MMEIATARRLMRRARVSDCGSPSTRQLLSEPKASSDTRDTRWASRVITHLRKSSCEPWEFLRRQPPEVAFRRRAPRSQGCEVRASSVLFDTEAGDKCPRKVISKQLSVISKNGEDQSTSTA